MSKGLPRQEGIYEVTKPPVKTVSPGSRGRGPGVGRRLRVLLLLHPPSGRPVPWDALIQGLSVSHGWIPHLSV